MFSQLCSVNNNPGHGFDMSQGDNPLFSTWHGFIGMPGPRESQICFTLTKSTNSDRSQNVHHLFNAQSRQLSGDPISLISSYIWTPVQVVSWNLPFLLWVMWVTLEKSFLFREPILSVCVQINNWFSRQLSGDINVYFSAYNFTMMGRAAET